MNVKIYCIFDENEIPLYIGKTKNSLLLRESQHQKRLNKKVYIFELDNVNTKEWKFWESYWIEQFQNWGFILKNKNKGGGGPEYHPKKVREKMNNTPRPGTSIKLKGKKRPDVSKRLKGTKLSKEICKKISQSKIGTIYSKERNNKIKSSNIKHYQKGSKRNKKISNKLQGRDITWNSKFKIPILQFDKNKNFIQEWDSASTVAQSLSKQSSAISECCSGKRKSAYGYVWEYKNKIK